MEMLSNDYTKKFLMEFNEMKSKRDFVVKDYMERHKLSLNEWKSKLLPSEFDNCIALLFAKEMLNSQNKGSNYISSKNKNQVSEDFFEWRTKLDFNEKSYFYHENNAFIKLYKFSELKSRLDESIEYDSDGDYLYYKYKGYSSSSLDNKDFKENVTIDLSTGHVSQYGSSNNYYLHYLQLDGLSFINRVLKHVNNFEMASGHSTICFA